MIGVDSAAATGAAGALPAWVRGDPGAAYPAHLVEAWTLADGTPVTIRPIRARDAALELTFLAGLSSPTRYQRLLSARNKLLPGELRRLTDIDHTRDRALVATILVGGRETMLGVARYVRLADDRSAEFAIVIGDRWQRRGLGEQLLRCLIAAAGEHALGCLTGFTLSTNRPMLALARKLRFAAHREPGDATLIHLVLLLDEPAQ